jgi:hypothetical protein
MSCKGRRHRSAICLRTVICVLSTKGYRAISVVSNTSAAYAQIPTRKKTRKKTAVSANQQVLDPFQGALLQNTAQWSGKMKKGSPVPARTKPGVLCLLLLFRELPASCWPWFAVKGSPMCKPIPGRRPATAAKQNFQTSANHINHSRRERGNAEGHRNTCAACSVPRLRRRPNICPGPRRSLQQLRTGLCRRADLVGLSARRGC